jgi:hypothetical protein
MLLPSRPSNCRCVSNSYPELSICDSFPYHSSRDDFCCRHGLASSARSSACAQTRRATNESCQQLQLRNRQRRRSIRQSRSPRRYNNVSCSGEGWVTISATARILRRSQDLRIQGQSDRRRKDAANVSRTRRSDRLYGSPARSSSSVALSMPTTRAKTSSSKRNS